MKINPTNNANGYETITMRPSHAALITVVVFLSHSVFSSETSEQETECAGKWIHIRRLPPRFNLDLLSNCSNYPLYDDFCPYLPNHGLGFKTHASSRSWYRTDPYMLELLFHRRILEFPCLTDDPDLATAIYVPYYAGIDSIKYLFGPEVNSSSAHGLDLFDFLARSGSEIWNRNLGHDHFVVMGRIAWDFSQPLINQPPIFGTSFLELEEFLNVTALTLESRAYPWQEMAIPYPTSFHPSNLGFYERWLDRVRRSRRSTMMVFAGGGGISANPNIRRSIRLECENSTKIDLNGTGYKKICDFVDCSNGVCEHDPIKFTRPMLGASFCLQPPGDTPTRRSTFDGIIAGCIPVFFDEMTAKKQYKWHLPEEMYEEFSVFIPKEEVVFNGLRIVDVLMKIPRAEVRRMREKVIEIMHRVMYRRHGSSLRLRNKKDAIDIAIEGTLERIKSKVQQLKAQQ